MGSKIIERAALGAISATAALGLAACGGSGGSVSVTTPAAGASTSSTPSASSSTGVPTVAPSEASSSAAAAKRKAYPKATKNGTRLKYGKPAVIDDSSSDNGVFRLRVKSLIKAPKAAYAKANVNKSAGTLYFVTFDLTYFGGSEEFLPDSLGLTTFSPAVSGKQRVIPRGTPRKDLPGGCKADSGDDMKVGETRSACYYYQVTGAAPHKVKWDQPTDDGNLVITWSRK